MSRENQMTAMDRDSIGDLNTESVKAGEFPGSIQIPGTQKVSIAIGGFAKTVAIWDSKAEQTGSTFIPALLSPGDREGAFSIDSTLTRVFLDARAPARRGGIRGYLEADLNNKNNGSLELKMRHAYGSWSIDNGMLTVGHTWSTMMDLKILPEGLTEPTVSGVIFQRQPIVRWSQPVGSGFTYHLAFEDPSSSDVYSDSDAEGKTSLPDTIMGIEYERQNVGHLRLNGILRSLKMDLPTGGDASDTAWGLTLTGHLQCFDKDKLTFSGVYGEGLGRYFLGIQSTAGSAVDPVRNKLELRKNSGAMVSYRHPWSDTLRTTAMAGYGHSKPLTWQSGDTFERSSYAAVNLMWSVLPYVTVGVEYAYGNRETNDGTDLDNQRLALGIQVF